MNKYHINIILVTTYTKKHRQLGTGHLVSPELNFNACNRFVKNSRIGLVFSVVGILNLIAAILLFAAGPIVATHQAWACDGWRGGCFTYGGWGTYTYGGFGFSSGGGFGGW